MILNIMDDIKDSFESFKELLMSSDHNFMFVIIFALGVIVFLLAYKALHKD